MRRMADPYYLHTVSMSELYQTTYQSRPPIIDGLLYAGAYILAGAPKIGKSFLVAQIAYHISTGKNCGITKCIRERCCILRWRTIISESKTVCS